MDTKWNNTEQPSLPGDILREAKPKKLRRPPGAFSALVSFLAYFLGLTLILTSIGSVGAQLVWERDLHPHFPTDWQETDEFRSEVCGILKDFLTIGAGGTLDFYNGDYWIENEDAVTYYSYPEAVYGNPYLWDWGSETAAVVQEAVPNRQLIPFDTGRFDTSGGNSAEVVTPGSEAPQKSQEPKGPGTRYKSDKNVLYSIVCKDGKRYDNCNGKVQNLEKQTLEGFNFYLTFQNGKATAVKDGKDIDLYGDGVYTDASQWFLPGYDNYPATEQLDGVSVRLAVRQTPSRYYAVDYDTGSSYSSGSMYYYAQRVQQIRDFYRQQAVMSVVGVLCLFVWFCLRKARVLADRKIASWTLHVWTEARFVIVLFCVLSLFFAGHGGRLAEVWWTIRYEDFVYGAGLSELAMSILRILLNNPVLLVGLLWVLWLLRNDHKHNPKEVRRSLLRPFLRGLRAKDLTRPIEKRISRQASLFALAMVLLGAETLYFLIALSMQIGHDMLWFLWTVCLIPLIFALLAALALAKRQLDLAKDLGKLDNQIETVRAGDLSTPLDLPADADLRQTADSLNDIQAGMKAALEEQTRSERMKVELVSNVSHDIKTPLTSILSYAELLRQEDLPPAASDYARIIDEKAHRLKGMVEDIFEISKAAADQLPVHPERLDLAKLLRQTMADLEEPIRSSSLVFKVDLPADPVMIVADGKRLYRVFQNLIDNALRYALEGSRVYLSLKTEGSSAQVSVRNTSRTELPEGVDFTARFVRGDASRTDGGSGLGLSIASSFTQACGGTFRVETLADLFTAIVAFPLG